MIRAAVRMIFSQLLRLGRDLGERIDGKKTCHELHELHEFFDRSQPVFV